jgi:hypothetical protein
MTSFRAVVLIAVLTASCSSTATDSTSTTAEAATASAATTVVSPDVATTAPAPSTTVASTTTSATTTTEPIPPGLTTAEIVEALASDEFGGRDNNTDGARLSQRLLIDELATFASPAFPGNDGDSGFLQPFEGGANVLAVIPGGELADEYIIVGSHYDHIGSDCKTSDPADTICNGATDSATGVAAAFAVARSIVADGTPKRSVLIAIWDREEDGLLGSEAYLTAPVAPLDKTIAYVNFDVQGATLLPALATTTVAVGAETGGQALIDATAEAAKESSLNTVQLSLLFGQGRSDHANFANAQIPTVFFTDANSPCYHTAQDDLGAVNFDKLDQQIVAATALTKSLISTNAPPVFNATAPASTYDDAVSMLSITKAGQPDFDSLTPEAAASSEQYIVDLQQIVDAGPEAFNDESVGILLGGAVTFVFALTQAQCQP